MNLSESFRVAAVQACPVYLDLERSVEKACSLIRDAGEQGAALAVFPEAFLPGYPVWAWFIPPGHTHPLREAYTELHANALAVPGPETERLGEAARRAGVSVVMGVNERNAEASNTTLYNTLLFFGPDGALLGKHRKLIPTGGERLIWGMGDGSDLEVYTTPFGRLGGLVCWENYMPLARHALAAMGEQIHAAPTWDRGEPWLSTIRHVAKESRCVVIGCCSAMRKDDVPDRLAWKAKYLADAGEWINPGDSIIVDPDGKILAGPVRNAETILTAEVRRDQLVGPRWQLDVAGHYARPDVFELHLHRKPRSQLTVTEGGDVRPDVSIREVLPADLPILYEHQADPEAVRMAAFPSRDRPAFDAHWAKVLADPSLVARTVVADGRVAGNVVCFGPPEERQIGYWFGREYWGRGIATRAVAAFLEVVRHRPLFGHVVRHNVASVRVLEKCGFTVLERREEAGSGEAAGEIVLRLG